MHFSASFYQFLWRALKLEASKLFLPISLFLSLMLSLAFFEIQISPTLYFVLVALSLYFLLPCDPLIGSNASTQGRALLLQQFPKHLIRFQMLFSSLKGVINSLLFLALSPLFFDITFPQSLALIFVCYTSLFFKEIFTFVGLFQKPHTLLLFGLPFLIPCLIFSLFLATLKVKTALPLTLCALLLLHFCCFELLRFCVKTK